MRSNDLRRERELRRREGYREIILHAANRIILRKGFSALTMDDVAREAQLSKATIYKYVDGKGSLLFDIVGHTFDDLTARAAAIADGPGTAAEKLGRIVQVVLQSGEEMKSINRILWMDKAMLKLMRLFAPPPSKSGAVPAGDRKSMGLLRQKRQRLIDIGARILTDGVTAGEFRRLDTAAASDFIESVLQGYMHMRFWQAEGPLPAAAADNLTRFIIEGIRNPELSGKEI